MLYKAAYTTRNKKIWISIRGSLINYLTPISIIEEEEIGPLEEN